MGAANVIPGVSGGTIAFITGIYERLIDALKSFNVKAVAYLLKFDFKGFAKHVDFGFLASLGFGVVLSVLTLAKVLKFAFEHYPTMVWAFFFGLIFASIFSVGKMVNRWGVGQVVSLVIGLASAVSLAFMTPAAPNAHPLYLMVCGVAAMCSMIIPGISGSFVLLLMGNYKLIMLDAVDNLRQMHFAESLPLLIPVGIGAVVGLIALSHVLSWLFKRYHDVAVSLIAGFVAGSLMIIWPWKEAVYSEDIPDKVVAWNRQLPDFSQSATWGALGLILLGVVIMIVMEKLSAKKEISE